MKIHYIIIAAALLFAGCKQNATEPAATEQQPAEEPAVVEEPEEEPKDETPVATESYFDSKAKSTRSVQTAATPQPTAKAAKKSGEAETIYVETDDSRGRVWGHVTMKGDRGTGTVHDEGENTWAVSVTRHGDELYAVDQNSRQYVFKLKNK